MINYKKIENDYNIVAKEFFNINKELKKHKGDNFPVTYPLDFAKKNILKELLVIKYYLFKEENYRLLDKKESDDYVNIYNILFSDENKSYLQELMDLEFNVHKEIDKDIFCSHLFRVSNHKYLNLIIGAYLNNPEILDEVNRFIGNKTDEKFKVIQHIISFMDDHNLTKDEKIKVVLFAFDNGVEGRNYLQEERNQDLKLLDITNKMINTYKLNLLQKEEPDSISINSYLNYMKHFIAINEYFFRLIE